MCLRLTLVRFYLTSVISIFKLTFLPVATYYQQEELHIFIKMRLNELKNLNDKDYTNGFSV